MIIIVIAAILPALVLLYYIYRKDKYQREPLSELILFFAFGIISALVAAPAEMLIEWLGLVPKQPTTWYGTIWKAFFGVALVEEGAKLFFLCRLQKVNNYFDERMDGIVYAVAIGMGFAAMENIGYLFNSGDQWLTLAIGRATFSVPGHFMFAVAMGYYYSVNHFRMSNRRMAFKMLTVPVLLHGIFDSLLMLADITPEWAGVIWLLFVVFCISLPKQAKNKINRLLEEDQQQANGSIITW